MDDAVGVEVSGNALASLPFEYDIFKVCPCGILQRRATAEARYGQEAQNRDAAAAVRSDEVALICIKLQLADCPLQHVRIRIAGFFGEDRSVH